MAGISSKAKTNTYVYPFIASVGLACLTSVVLLVGRFLFTDTLRYVFLLWNLVLALVPVFLAWWLYERLKTGSWYKWQQILLTFLFIGFLPNTFYLITDFVHIHSTDEAGLYFDVVMLSSFVFNGMILGFVSIYLVHKQLLRRVSEKNAMALIGVVFLLTGFAAYLGRFTRFNTWDIILRPAGLLFDVSDRFVNPTQHTETYLATITLFLVLFSTYSVMYYGLKLTKALKT